MGVYTRPSIITNGLVLNLDAANIKSYPGSGTTWSDLSGNANNGTLTPGVSGLTFSRDGGGSLVFDGSNDVVSVNSVVPTGDSSKSIFMVFKSTTAISTRQWLFYSGTETNGGRFALEIETSKFTFNFYNSAIQPTTLTTNTWYYAGVTYNSTTKQLLIYVNGILQSTTTFPLTIGPNVTYLNTGVNATNYIGNIFNASITMNGNISLTQIYNRALSTSEVLQNYNALKSRFNLS
jgi:hypothetical protein